jgi:hypothetical protein
MHPYSCNHQNQSCILTVKRTTIRINHASFLLQPSESIMHYSCNHQNQSCILTVVTIRINHALQLQPSESIMHYSCNHQNQSCILTVATIRTNHASLQINVQPSEPIMHPTKLGTHFLVKYTTCIPKKL